MILRENKLFRVAILLATYNGVKYIEKQIESIINQIEIDWTLYISDDNSTDGTLEYLLELKNNHYINSKIILLKGPQKGHCSNFLSLIDRCKGDFEYYSFCDQDDYWKPNKLITAIKTLEDQELKDNLLMPLLYCGRTDYVDNNLQFIIFIFII